MNLSISRDGAEIGEWTEDEVRSLYKQGQLLPADLYWKEGMTDWKQLGTLMKPPPPSAKLEPPQQCRVCESCSQTIPTQALKCPYCQAWRKEIAQGRNEYFSMMAIIVVFGVLGCLGFLAFFEECRQSTSDPLLGLYGSVDQPSFEFYVRKFFSSFWGWFAIVCGIGSWSFQFIIVRYRNSLDKKWGSRWRP